MLEWLKENTDCHWYDLVGGLSNPGIRQFKFGLAKVCGQELHIQDYARRSSLLNRLVGVIS